ncbi:MAG: MMPL family transporter [Reichenbachiella sp.]
MINHRNSWISILVALLAIFYFALQLPDTEFDYEMENFFPMEDPDLAYYKDYSAKFGTDVDYLLIALKDNSGIFNVNFLSKVKDLTSALKEVPGTNKVVSLLDGKKMIKSPMGYIGIPYLHLTQDSLLYQDSLRLVNDKFIRESYFSNDMESLIVMVDHKRFREKDNSDNYVETIRSILNEYEIDKKRIVGKAVAQKVFIGALEKDFTTFLVYAILLVLFMLILFMKNPVMIATSLGISGLSLVSTLGLMALTGKKIDALSTLIPSILLVVSMSDIIHLFSQIKIEFDKNTTMINAVNQAVRKIGVATLLTSITTAIGFITLISINVKPVIGLGLYSALGIFIAFTITYSLAPQIILLVNPNINRRPQNRRFYELLRYLLHVIYRKEKEIIITTVFVTLVVVYGISLLKVNAYLIEDLPNDSPVKEDFLYFDQNSTGSKPFSLSLWTTDSTKSIYSKEVIQEIEKLEILIDTVLETGSLISPVSFVKAINQSLNGGKSSEYKLPEREQQWRKVFTELKRLKPESKSFNVTYGNEARISGFSQDHGTSDSHFRRSRFQALAREHINNSIIEYRVTGTSLLIDKSHDVLSLNLIKGLLIALLIVGIISGLMFRSFKMTLIALFPNIFPILSVAAIMGYLSIPINLSSSVIFAISFGIVVDDTIHFLSKFKMEKDNGLSNLYAIKRTLLSTGEPIIITTIVLTSGFIVFCFSSFNASFYIGLFVSISFLVALLADLILLPVLILKFLPETNKKAKKE